MYNITVKYRDTTGGRKELSMIIDNKGKLFGKVSIVDILIVVIVLAAVGGFVFVFQKSKIVSPFTQKEDTIQIKFYAEEWPDYALNAIKIGDLAKNLDTNTVFGNVTDIKMDKSISWVESDRGEFVKSTKEGYSSVIITVEGKGIFRDSKTYAGVTFGGTDFVVGKLVVLLAGKATLQCRIYDIQKKG